MMPVNLSGLPVDEQLIPYPKLADLHQPTLEAYAERIFDQPLDQLNIPTEQLLRNLKLYTQDSLNRMLSPDNPPEADRSTSTPPSAAKASTATPTWGTSR